MPTATLTSKGQLTVPKAIRDQLHLRPGDRLEFTLESNGTLSVSPLTRRVAEVFGMFSHRATTPCSTEKLNEELGKAFKDGRL